MYCYGKKRKFTSQFKTKVVLEALKERSSLTELAQKYELHPQQITTWKRTFLSSAESVFSQPGYQLRTDWPEEKARLLQIIEGSKKWNWSF
ncbi:MAG: transposase [Bacteroidia bacterium]